MRQTLAILTAGLALSASLCVSVTGQARADTVHGCYYLQNVGSENYGEVGDGYLYFLLPHTAVSTTFFCNLGISVNGEFQISFDQAPGGCLAVNSSSGVVGEESAAGCATSGGEGYPWDRWTAISIKYHNNQLWMFQSVFERGWCIENDQASNVNDVITYYEPCDTSNHNQWFSWPGSGL